VKYNFQQILNTSHKFWTVTINFKKWKLTSVYTTRQIQGSDFTRKFQYCKYERNYSNTCISPVHTERVDARLHASTRQIKLMLKIVSIHTDRVDACRRASSNLHTSNERCQFRLYIGYWTSNNNKWPKCPCRYRTPSPDNTCTNNVIDIDVTDNDVIDSWMNMYTLLANRPNVVASTRRARCMWTGFRNKEQSSR